MDYKQNNTTAEEKQDLPGWYYNHSKIIIIYNCNKLINNNSVENMIKYLTQIRGSRRPQHQHGGLSQLAVKNSLSDCVYQGGEETWPRLKPMRRFTQGRW